ncbi:hypothetical protein Gpo141_00002399 [Globisporangium polare]
MSEKLFAELCICTTGLEVHVKEQIRKIVLACGGAFDDDLALDTTTHLIADAVGSQKHRAAEAHNIQIAAPKWVFESFRAHALLDIASFRLRTLEGLVICTTGLAAQSRDQVERMAVMHGAQYDPNLEVGYTSVLIAQRPGGAKYDACVDHGIPVVHISWLHACVENQTLLDESEFALEKILRPSRLFSQLQEEVQQVMTALPQLVRRYRKQHQDGDEERSSGCGDDTDDSDEEVEWMELFDSCIFHLVGFPAKMEASLQQLIRTSMGTIYYELSTSHVTHVLVSPSLRDLNALARLEEQVGVDNADGHIHFVSTKWLLDSVKCLRSEPEELYPVEVDTEHEVAQPPPVTFSAPVYTPNAADTTVDASFDQLPDVEDAYQDPQNSTELRDEPVTAGEHEPSSKSHHTRRLFSGCAFLLLCRDPDDRHLIKPMVKQIQRQSGAQAIALNFQDLAHLDVSQFAFITHIVICNGVDLDADVAMQVEQQLSSLQEDDDSGSVNNHSTSTATSSRKRHRRVTFVSDLWVNCCLAAEVKLSHQAHELFSLTVHQTRSVFSLPLPLACFSKVRASTSVYVGVDRLVVMELLRLAGAQATSKMSKRNTHLICLKPIGMKYEKAKEWGLAIVTARWLIQSMMQGTLLDADAEEFQVKDDTAENGGDNGEHNGDVEMSSSQQDYEE